MIDIRISTAFMILALIALAGCQSNKSAAEQAVRERLKDPESAQFGDFYFNKETKRGCLIVNAKNSMGGYSGDRMAMLEKADDGWEVLLIDETPAETCKSVADSE